MRPMIGDVKACGQAERPVVAGDPGKNLGEVASLFELIQLSPDGAKDCEINEVWPAGRAKDASTLASLVEFYSEIETRISSDITRNRPLEMGLWGI